MAARAVWRMTGGCCLWCAVCLCVSQLSFDKTRTGCGGVRGKEHGRDWKGPAEEKTAGKFAEVVTEEGDPEAGLDLVIERARGGEYGPRKRMNVGKYKATMRGKWKSSTGICGARSLASTRRSWGSISESKVRLGGKYRGQEPRSLASPRRLGNLSASLRVHERRPLATRFLIWPRFLLQPYIQAAIRSQRHVAPVRPRTMAELAYHHPASSSSSSASYYAPPASHYDDDATNSPPSIHDPRSTHSSSPQPPSPLNANKPDPKPQATFLTKLYALLERPENQPMIRWDAAGEHIIVERPEQLALHVLPSIYRQSRFASFSRQLNVRYALCNPLRRIHACMHARGAHSFYATSDLWFHAQGQSAQRRSRHRRSRRVDVVYVSPTRFCLSSACSCLLSPSSPPTSA
jgi:hypothetical protein